MKTKQTKIQELEQELASCNEALEKYHYWGNSLKNVEANKKRIEEELGHLNEM